jgi:C4-type Zn-finger protein
LTLIDWQLITQPSSGDKYIDKHIVGTVKNDSEKEFSEVRIEFSVYDEQGAQIAIVFSNLYDFKPGGIWKFDIVVTDDVAKAVLKGLYVPSKEKELEEQRKGKGEKGV